MSVIELGGDGFRRLVVGGLLIGLLGLVGCATDNLGVIAETGLVGSVPDFRSFEVQADQLPAFLGPIIVSNFSVAMAERGLQPLVSGGDAKVTLSYVQEDKRAIPANDAFEGRIDQGGEARFVARILVEVRAVDGGPVLWSGSIARLHSIRPGDYMHTGTASVAFLEAFRELLVSYPVVPEPQ